MNSIITSDYIHGVVITPNHIHGIVGAKYFPPYYRLLVIDRSCQNPVNYLVLVKHRTLITGRKICPYTITINPTGCHRIILFVDSKLALENGSGKIWYIRWVNPFGSVLIGNLLFARNRNIRIFKKIPNNNPAKVVTREVIFGWLLGADAFIDPGATGDPGIPLLLP